MEWYGSKESALAVATDPDNAKIAEECGKKLDEAIKKLAAKVGADVNVFDVKESIQEMDDVSKKLCRMEDVTAFMLDVAEKYVTSPEMQKRLDAVYGEGSTLFIGRAPGIL